MFRKVREKYLCPSPEDQSHANACPHALGEHEMPVFFAPACSENAGGEKDAAAREAMVKPAFVNLGANDYGHEEEEEYLKGADPGECGRGMVA